MSIIRRDLALESIEEKLEWYEALEYCLNKWYKDRINVELLLRVLLEAWFLLAYWQQIDHWVNGERIRDFRIPLDYDRVISALEESFKYGDQYFYDNASYLCLTGYLMYVTPEWFSLILDWTFEEIINEGEARLHKLKLMNNAETDIVREVMFENKDIGEETAGALFPGSSQTDLYFKGMFIHRH